MTFTNGLFDSIFWFIFLFFCLLLWFFKKVKKMIISRTYNVITRTRRTERKELVQFFSLDVEPFYVNLLNHSRDRNYFLVSSQNRLNVPRGFASPSSASRFYSFYRVSVLFYESILHLSGNRIIVKQFHARFCPFI